MGGKEGERVIPERKTQAENIPGWREGQGLPATSLQQSHSRTCQAARAKYRGRESQAQGGGAPPATLTQPKQATPSTTSSVKSSRAARPGGSCLGTWTMSQPKLPLAESPGLASRARGQAEASCGSGPRSQEMQSSGHYTRSEAGGKGQEGTRKEGD